MKRCPHCDKSISDFVTVCPNCHNDVNVTSGEAVVIKKSVKSVKNLGKVRYIPFILAAFTILLCIIQPAAWSVRSGNDTVLASSGFSISNIVNFIIIILLSAVLFTVSQRRNGNKRRLLAIIALALSVLIIILYILQDTLRPYLVGLGTSIQWYLYSLLNVVSTQNVVHGYIFRARGWRGVYFLSNLKAIGFFATHISVIILSVISLMGKNEDA